MKIFQSFLFGVIAVAPIYPVHSSLTYVSPTSSCISIPALGKSTFCCNGVCTDGTRIGNPGGCSTFDDQCLDPITPPVCGNTQVMKGLASEQIDAGIGCCYGVCSLPDACQWQRFNWTWSCCDCPAGYVAEDRGGCGVSVPDNCVGCSDPGEVLVQNGNQFSCVKGATSSSKTASIKSSSSTSKSSSSIQTSLVKSTTSTKFPSTSVTSSKSSTSKVLSSSKSSSSKASSSSKTSSKLSSPSKSSTATSKTSSSSKSISKSSSSSKSSTSTGRVSSSSKTSSSSRSPTSKVPTSSAHSTTKH